MAHRSKHSHAGQLFGASGSLTWIEQELPFEDGPVLALEVPAPELLEDLPSPPRVGPSDEPTLF